MLDNTSVPAPVFSRAPVLVIFPLKVPVPEATLTVLVPARVIALLALMPADKSSVVVSDMAKVPVPKPLLLPNEIVPAERVIPVL